MSEQLALFDEEFLAPTGPLLGWGQEEEPEDEAPEPEPPEDLTTQLVLL